MPSTRRCIRAELMMFYLVVLNIGSTARLCGTSQAGNGRARNVTFERWSPDKKVRVLSEVLAHEPDIPLVSAAHCVLVSLITGRQSRS